MTYCDNSQCPFKDCQHHICHAPRGFAVTTRDMDKNCQRYAEHLEAEEAKKDKMRRMTLGDAYLIFRNIDTVDMDDEIKGLAIWKIANLETHNGVTKDMMLKVIWYLLGLCFELPEGERHE